MDFARLRSCCLTLAVVAGGAGAAQAPLPAALRQVDPRTLSSGLYLALAQDGAFGGVANRTPVLAAASGAAKGPAPSILDARVGENVNLGPDPAALPTTQRGQAEPHLWRSAVTPDFLVGTFQEGRYAAGGGSLDVGYGLSSDGGLTWTRALLPQLTTTSGGPYVRATDPVAAVDLLGNVFINALTARQQGFADGGVVVVCRSTDGGQTFGSPVVVAAAPNSSHAYDKNWLAVNDFPGTPNVNRLVAAYADITSDTSYDLRASVSDDHGLTWSTPVLVKPHDALINQSVIPSFLPDGTLLVCYITALTNTTMRIECRRSLDGGRTFPGSSTTVVGSVSLWNDPVLRSGTFLITTWVARDSGAVFLTYIGRDGGGTPRAFVTRSVDHGSSWSVPVAASDNAPGVAVVNAAVAASPDGQRVTVTYYDKRNDTGSGVLVDVYASTSLDGGLSWEPALRLTEYSSDVRSAPLTSEGYMLGDYQGLNPPVAPGQPAVALTMGTRNGNPDPLAIRFALSATEDFPAWQSARFDAADLDHPAASGPNADPDGDGYANLAEYALATDPHAAESGVSFDAAPLTADSVALSLRVRRTADFRVQFQGESSGDWTALSPVAVLDPLPGGGGGATTRLTGGDYQFAAPTEVRVAFALNDAGTFDVCPPERYTFGGDARLVNVSTRGIVGIDPGQLIVGFVLDREKSVLVRGAGPLLTSFGVSDALSDPQLRIVRPGDGQQLAANDNWGSTASAPALASAFARLGAVAFADGSADAALIATLPGGVFTALVAGAGNTTGVALGEIYDADVNPGAPDGPRLTNLSARGQVGVSTEPTLIAGFVVTGTQPRRVLIRAVGPSLAGAGVTMPLADPELVLFHSVNGATPVIADNDDWSNSRTPAATLTSTAARLGAFPLAAESLDAALLVSLDPGVYTAQVSAPAGQTRIALVEVYDAD